MIVGFIILIIIIIVLAILDIKTFTNQKLYKKKYNDLDKAAKEIINRQQKAIDEKVIKYKELDELYEQKISKYEELKKKLKEYEKNNTHFVKQEPMNSVCFRNQLVVPKDLHNDKDYMESLEHCICAELAKAIYENKAYETIEQYNPHDMNYHIYYTFRYFK